MEDAKTNTYALHNLVWNFNKFIVWNSNSLPGRSRNWSSLSAENLSNGHCLKAFTPIFRILKIS